MLEHVREHGVTAFVEGDALLFGLRQHQALASLPHEHAVARGLEVLLVHLVRAPSHGVQGRLVDQVGEVGPAHPRGAARHELEVDVSPMRLSLQWTFRIGRRSSRSGRGTTIWRSKPPGSQQGGIEDVGAVGGGHDDHALGGVEPVHLREHLVERLLPLVVAAAEPGPPLAADGVDLVHEDDGGGLLARRLEEVAHPAGADPDEHLHEVRPAHREERHPRLTGDGPGQQRLPGARAGPRAGCPWGSWRRCPGSGAVTSRSRPPR